jgi:phytoene dehydrogenase-like protein
MTLAGVGRIVKECYASPDSAGRQNVDLCHRPEGYLVLCVEGQRMQSYIVIGGGLAGLTAANALAGNHRKVVLYEQSARLGGRAATQEDRGFLLNFGPHALYRGGRAHGVWREWRIPFHGAVPDVTGDAFLTYGDTKYDLIRNTGGLLRSRLFRLGEKLEATRLFGGLVRGSAQPGESMDHWLDRHAATPRVRSLAEAITRVSTYTAEMPHLSAEAALAQIRLATRRGVLYLDGGWHTIIDGLARRAQALGVEIRCGESLDSLRHVDASAVILAIPPKAIERLTGVRLPVMRPVRMATLDLGLRSLPVGAARFALGMDRPLYLSLHSAAARLAPAGAALVHVGKYLSQNETDANRIRAELECHVDLCLPGWRDQAEIVRYLPNLTVTHATAAPGGRPDVDALGLEGVAIAGDWVGPEGMLADAAVASGLRAAAVVQRREVKAA